MKILTREGCLKLLKKYNAPENIIKHRIITNKICMFIAKTLIEKGEKINLKLLNCASLLHDIAKYKCLKNDKEHGSEGYKILLSEGYKEIGLIVKVHMLAVILKKDSLKTWEEKIIYYADKRVTHDKIVSIKERLNYLRKRYPHAIDVIDKAEPLIYSLEKEIFSEININPEDLLKLK